MMTPQKNICQNFFYSIEIRDNGCVNVCSPAFMKYEDCYIGNIFEEDFAIFWNGTKARNLRRLALDGKYPHCKLDKCAMLVGLMFKPDIDTSGGFSEIIESYPTHVVFSHDNQCNVRCLFCRDCLLHHNSDKIKEMDSRIESHFLPICKDAKIVKLQGAGEIFASRHSRNLTKAIAQRYPDIKFHIQSNGILFDKKNCDDLGITERLHKAVICAHAATENTYDKIVKDGNFKAVLKNLEWLGDLKKDGMLPHFYIGFVVTALNYMEMKNYIELARSVGAQAYFVQLRVENDPTYRNERKLAITDETHPKYNDFLAMLQDKIFDSPDCHLDNVFKTLKPIKGSYKKIRYFVNYYREEAKSWKSRFVGKMQSIHHKTVACIKKKSKPSYLIFPPTQGLGSFGDQAMVLTTIHELKQKHGKSKIGLLNYYKEDDFVPKYFPEIENLHLALQWARFNDVSKTMYREIIKKYKHIILMGADVLDGFYNIDQLQTFVKIAKIAKESRKRVTTLGFSYNGNDNPQVVEYLKELSTYTQLNVRDEVSLERLKALGVENLFLVADVALLFDHNQYPLDARTGEFIESMKRSEKKLIGINVNFAKDAEKENEVFIHEFLKSLKDIDRNIYEFLLIAHDTREHENQYSDIQSLNILKDKMEHCDFVVRFPNWITTHIESKALTGLCDFIIGNRMHLAVSALALGVPVISFEYQGKFEGLYKLYHLEKGDFIFDKKAPDWKAFENSVKFILNNSNELSKTIKYSATDAIRLAKENFSRI